MYLQCISTGMLLIFQTRNLPLQRALMIDGMKHKELGESRFFIFILLYAFFFKIKIDTFMHGAPPHSWGSTTPYAAVA